MQPFPETKSPVLAGRHPQLGLAARVGDGPVRVRDDARALDRGPFSASTATTVTRHSGADTHPYAEAGAATGVRVRRAARLRHNARHGRIAVRRRTARLRHNARRGRIARLRHNARHARIAARLRQTAHLRHNARHGRIAARLRRTSRLRGARLRDGARLRSVAPRRGGVRHRHRSQA